ncbi:2'-5' RNA ligase family protein [Devosia sp. SL43]|uniref:2'-5' RNA ligase family protein n=1 Tax=Devosia sp. SL43 TaxID=2806348 RepID=UPI001F26BA3D|nr:2'-5' RNA ligase family protein [Devosia sp. SL43]UJW86792.1 2'-5' RNA ligase family protein [Devosia sp. SL43]
MAYAFCLLLDEGTDASVRSLWQALVTAGAGDHMLQLGYPPHLSLAVLDEEPPREVVDMAFASVAGGRSIELTLGPARRFEGTTIAWLAVEAGDALRDLHRSLSETLPTDAVREHYRPAVWTPHVTLQITGDVDRALAIADAAWPEPVQARFTAVELVQFPPVTVLKSVALR